MSAKTVALRLIKDNLGSNRTLLPPRVESAAAVVRALYWSAPRRHPLRLVPRRGA